MRRLLGTTVAMLLALPLASWVEPASACNLCGRRCIVCCCCQGGCGHDRGEAPRESRSRGSDPVVAPLVQSQPVFAMPVMFASMPMMPAMAMQQPVTRGAETKSACDERIDKIETQVTNLARSVRDLQTIVEGQIRVMEKLSDSKADK